MFTLFSKKEPTPPTQYLQPGLEEALVLVERVIRLTSPYLYEKGYKASETEAKLLKKLHEACKHAHMFIGIVARDAEGGG